MKLFLALIFLCVPSFAQKAERYDNAAFEFSVEVPRDLLPKATDIAGGRRFASADGSVVVSTFGKPGTPTCDALASAESFRPSLKLAKEDWCVISGLAGDHIVYQKSIAHDGSSRFLRLEYPASRKTEFDAVVRRVVKTFAVWEHLRAEVLEVFMDLNEVHFVTEAQNDQLVCEFAPESAAAFKSVKEGQTISVIGVPADSNLRVQTAEWSGLYRHTLHACRMAPKSALAAAVDVAEKGKHKTFADPGSCWGDSDVPAGKVQVIIVNQTTDIVRAILVGPEEHELTTEDPETSRVIVPPGTYHFLARRANQTPYAGSRTFPAGKICSFEFYSDMP
jgi:hypothetical protein